MEDFEVLAERSLSLRNKTTNATEEIRVVIGMPHWVQEGVSVACPVSIVGLVGRVDDIKGIDFMNAIELSLSFIAGLLSNRPSENEVLWPDGESYP
jgi:hypothetical protein